MAMRKGEENVHEKIALQKDSHIVLVTSVQIEHRHSWPRSRIHRRSHGYSASHCLRKRGGFTSAGESNTNPM